MPNQLAQGKRRQSLAEHEAVLAALAALSRYEDVTIMALLRQAVRELIRNRVAAAPRQAEALRAAVWHKAPRMPARFKTAAQVARFKRMQREFDQAVLDLGLVSPALVQERNSIVSSSQVIRLIDFDQAHAASL
jgi:hypothetical protein